VRPNTGHKRPGGATVTPVAEYVYNGLDGSFYGVRDPNDPKNTDACATTEQWYFRMDERDE